jgi:hypothetical protein
MRKMADKGIIFSAPMVRALLAGRKTQTRRLLSLRGHREFTEFGASDTPGYDWHFRRADGCWCDHRSADLPLPYAQGDRLYVREAWRVSPDACEGGSPETLRDWIDFRAGGYEECVAPSFKAIERAAFLKNEPVDWDFLPSRYRPSIHMPRWASRLWLEVAEVRVQRLQDISETDAIAEGQDWVAPGMWSVDRSVAIIGHDPRAVYAELWDSLHAKPGTTWADNPWIVAVSFAVHHGNIDGDAHG